MTAAELRRNRSAISATASTLFGFAIRVASSLVAWTAGTPDPGDDERPCAAARGVGRAELQTFRVLLRGPPARSRNLRLPGEGPAVFGRTSVRVRDRVSALQITLHDGRRARTRAA